VNPLEKQMSIAAFVDDLLTQVPELAPLHRRHIEAHQGLVPAVFIAELARLVAGPANPAVGTDPVARLRQLLQRALDARDIGVRELVRSSLADDEAVLRP